MSKTIAKAAATAILTVAATEKLIVSIKGRGAKLDKDVHQAALSALDHHAKHGDITVMNRLIAAMPKSGRTNALVAWALAQNARIIRNPAKDAAVTFVHDKEVASTWDLAKADATPFWEFKAKEGVSVFAYDTYMTSLTKGLERALAAAQDEGQKAKLRAILAATALPVEAPATAE